MSSNRRIFLKQLGIGTLGAGVFATFPGRVNAFGDAKFVFPRSKPEQQGILSSGIVSFLDAIEKSKIEFHSLMILRHGQVVAEGWWSPYAPELTHTLYSLSKSFTSTAVGLAIAEGRFALDSPVISFFPKDLPADVSSNLAAMNVQHLLTMSTGHIKDTIPDMRTGTDPNWAKVFLGQPVEKVPGTYFLYNTGATYMLSAIVQKTTGKPLMQYLKPRLFDPLGMEGMDWETDPMGINVGGYGLRVKTEDIAKLGQLYLQKGKWDAIEILPPDWVADATTSHIDNAPKEPTRPNDESDWSQGYCYQFWRCRHNAFRGDGAFGQFCIVMPEKDVVVAITSESFDLQASMNLVWDNLLPAIKDGSLPADAKEQKILQQKLKGLSISPPVSDGAAGSGANISGKKFVLDENPFKVKSVGFTLGGNKCTFVLTDEKGDHSVKCGVGSWVTEENGKTQEIFPIQGRPVVTTPIASSISWTDKNTLMMTIRYFATAHSDNIIFGFENDNVTIKFLSSVAKGNPGSPDKRGEIRGRVN